MGGVPGSGLARGLAVTLGTMTRRSHTQQYPDVPPDLPPRSRGVIALLEENCTVCMLCARECPDWCIYIDSHKEEVQIPGAARPRQRNVLDRFAIDFSLCMYCGICIEVCPFDALFWTPEFEYAEYDIRELLHEKEHLGEWMATVPSPPAHDPNGEPAKAEQAAARATSDEQDPAARATPDGQGRPARPGPGDRPRPARGDRATPRPSRGDRAAPDQARGEAGAPGQARGEAAGPPPAPDPEGGAG